MLNNSGHGIHFCPSQNGEGSVHNGLFLLSSTYLSQSAEVESSFILSFGFWTGTLVAIGSPARHSFVIILKYGLS